MKKSDHARWRLVEKTACRYAKAFGLRLRRVKLMGPKYAGLCESDGTIYVSLRDRDGLRKSYFVLDTIAHELAHLAFFNHRSEWVRLFAKILTRMSEKKEFDRFRRAW
jgi:predicted metal-dependent hydrolase